MLRTSHALLAAGLALSCEDGQGTINEPAETWITEAAFEIGDVIEGGALFTRVDDVQVSSDGARVFVLEGSIERLSVWSPEGSPLLDLGGRGGGPGEFEGAAEIGLTKDGFFVRDLLRFTFFADDGSVLKTVSFPPPSVSFRGFRVEPGLLLEGEGFLAVPAIPARVMAGWHGDDPIHELPLLRLVQDGDRWAIDTLLMLDQRNRDLNIGRPHDHSNLWGVHTRQPFHDSDAWHFDAGTESVLILRQNLGPGVLELTEISATGDTVWKESLARRPIPFLPAVLEDYAEWLVQGLVGQAQGSGASLSRDDARAAVDEAFYVPDFYPAADFFRGMSDDVWFKTFETAEVDTLDVWYALKRGADASGLRRIMLPKRFRPHCVTDTHVWGVRRDTLGINYVAGRRLLRTGVAGK